MLELVYLPMSSQEASWFKEVVEVEKLLRQSDFYLIGGRAEAVFTEFRQDRHSPLVNFKVTISGGLSDEVTLDLSKLPGTKGVEPQNLHWETDRKGIRIWDGPDDDASAKIVEWFTTEKLLRDRYRGRPGVEGLNRHREMTVYDLLYVGIARMGDSFDRVIAKGHEARMEILNNEPQRFPGARVANEIYLFLFSINSFVVRTLDPDADIDAQILRPSVTPKQIVADAEKAIVSLLKPNYNRVRFSQYPKGKDGLYGAGLSRYCYTISEDLTFITAHGSISGSYGRGLPSNDADVILVDGDEVQLLKFGVDFPIRTQG